MIRVNYLKSKLLFLFIKYSISNPKAFDEQTLSSLTVSVEIVKPFAAFQIVYNRFGIIHCPSKRICYSNLTKAAKAGCENILADYTSALN